MKNRIKFVLVFFGLLVFYSCNSRPNEMKEPVNSTMSGSHATKTSDSSKSDTLNPVQPNGMDTSGEQTGRMNKPLGNIPQQKTGDSSIKMNQKK